MTKVNFANEKTWKFKSQECSKQQQQQKARHSSTHLLSQHSHRELGSRDRRILWNSWASRPGIGSETPSNKVEVRTITWGGPLISTCTLWYACTHIYTCDTQAYTNTYTCVHTCAQISKTNQPTNSYKPEWKNKRKHRLKEVLFLAWARSQVQIHFPGKEQL